MKIKFLREFGGRETGEIHYPEGFVLNLDDDEIALGLINRSICASDEPIPEPKPEPVVKAKPINKARRGGK